MAAAISGGKILAVRGRIRDTHPAKLRDAGADIETGEDDQPRYARQPSESGRLVPRRTGLPDRYAAQFTLLNLVAEGTGVITKQSFENRFMHIPELIRIGAHAEIESNTAICHGAKQLFCAQVMATDLRASASLVLAGCIAEGTTIVNRIYHIDRGYRRLEDQLQALGANIQRVKGKSRVLTAPDVGRC